MAQDPALDNLHHDAGTVTVPFGTLGRVRRAGTGPRRILLIPGLGFGDHIWSEYMDRHTSDATMIAVTLPGFGGTSPLPMPAAGTPFSDLTWTRSAVRGIEALLDEDHVDRVTIVAHWALATQIALRLALDHPDRVDAVVAIGGPLKVYYEAIPAMLAWTAAERAGFVEGLASRWFKSVTRRTWDDNNFMPYDYAVNPRRGLFLWREAQAPALPVWIRYLLEFYSIDQSAEIARLQVPALIVQPGFDDGAFYVEPDRNYMRNLCIDSWRQAKGDTMSFVTVPRSRLFVMFDQPEELDRVVGEFLERRAPPRGASRP
jgi:pimeloyl-ACP methyl ester carboxylesterase